MPVYNIPSCIYCHANYPWIFYGKNDTRVYPLPKGRNLPWNFDGSPAPLPCDFLRRWVLKLTEWVALEGSRPGRTGRTGPQRKVLKYICSTVRACVPVQVYPTLLYSSLYYYAMLCHNHIWSILFILSHLFYLPNPSCPLPTWPRPPAHQPAVAARVVDCAWLGWTSQVWLETPWVL